MSNAFTMGNAGMSKMIAMSNANYDILLEIVNEVIGNGGPSGVFDTLQELNDRYPKGAKGVYLITINGKWYYWDGEEWAAGGVYQATQLSDGSVTEVKLEIGLQEKIQLIPELLETVNNFNERLTFVIAHNGDGKKDTELIDARGGAPVLGYRLNSIDEQLAETTKKTDTFVNVENFNTLADAIVYCRENKKTLLAGEITLNENISLRGVAFNIDKIILNGFSLELGGYSNIYGYNPHQYVRRIVEDAQWETEKVFIRGASGQTIEIVQYLGIVCFRTNDDLSNTETYDSAYIAYNTFNFNTVRGIDIANDSWVISNPSLILWCNENVFRLNNIKKFTMNGSYSHNLNRIYGGCFEGNTAEIHIKNGHNNVFYDLRFEAPNGATQIQIKFDESTYDNKIYSISEYYYPTITDRGAKNVFIKQVQQNLRLVARDEIKSHAFNSSFYAPFKNFQQDGNRLSLVSIFPDSEVYESSFFDNPKSKVFLMECILAQGYGFGIKYRVFDENFNDISEEWRVDDKKLYIVTSAKSNVESGSEGSYVLPYGVGGNIANSSSRAYQNDKVIFHPSEFWRVRDLSGLTPIKYVKFYVTYSPAWGYDNATAQHTKIYALRVSVYDNNNNYHSRYYNN